MGHIKKKKLKRIFSNLQEGRKGETERKIRENRKYNQMTDLNANISIIVLNVNDFNRPIKT